MTTDLKNEPGSYEPRLERFFKSIVRVRKLPPRDHHLWKVMDTTVFEDLEAELKRTLDNQRKKIANDS